MLHPFATFISQPFGPHPQNAADVEYLSSISHSQTKKAKTHAPDRDLTGERPLPVLIGGGSSSLERKAQPAFSWAVAQTFSFMQARASSLRREAIEALDRYSGYSKGWDGYDGEVFEAETIEKARRAVEVVLSYFRTIPLRPEDDLQTGPAGDGSIDIDTTFGGKKLLVTIYPGPEGLHVSLEEGGMFDREVGSFDEATLDRWLDRLTSQEVLRESRSRHSETA